MAIERGLKTAFATVNNTVQGYPVEFVTQDHRGNVFRSHLNLKDFLSDPQALLVMAGAHSPPLIRHQRFINDNHILTLVPWAAGAAIIRSEHDLNWIFRLSLDDSVVGVKLMQFAFQQKQCSQPALLLERTSWGSSNLTVMSKTFEKLSSKPLRIYWFDLNIKLAAATEIVDTMVQQGADCVVFVGSSIEGSYFVTAMSLQEQKLPIISHWGVLAGDLHQRVPYELRRQVDLSFIQTCFAFSSVKSSPFSDSVLRQATKFFPADENLKQMPAAVGFIHAFDLGLILIQALNQVELTDNMATNRFNLHHALENLEQPVKGLLKTYRKPFSKPKTTFDNAHEALDVDDLCMARFDSKGQAVLIDHEIIQ